VPEAAASTTDIAGIYVTHRQLDPGDARGRGGGARRPRHRHHVGPLPGLARTSSRDGSPRRSTSGP
jgi:hypothetical protein